MCLSKLNGISQDLNNNGNDGWGVGMRLLSFQSEGKCKGNKRCRKL